MKKRSLVFVLVLMMIFVSSLAFAGAEGSEEGILSNSEEAMLIADNGNDNGDDDGGNGDSDLDVEVDIGENGEDAGLGNIILYVIIGAVVVVVIVAIVSMTNSSKKQ